MRDSSPYRVEGSRVKRRVRLVAVANNPVDVVNRVTGEVSTATPYIGNRAWRDIGEFVKLYDVDALWALKRSELGVMLYALKELDFDGRFKADEDKMVSFTGLKRSMVYYGLKGLTEKDFVRRDSKGWYWINPNIAFRGNRDELLDLNTCKL